MTTLEAARCPKSELGQIGQWRLSHGLPVGVTAKHEMNAIQKTTESFLRRINTPRNYELQFVVGGAIGISLFILLIGV